MGASYSDFKIRLIDDVFSVFSEQGDLVDLATLRTINAGLRQIELFMQDGRTQEEWILRAADSNLDRLLATATQLGDLEQYIFKGWYPTEYPLSGAGVYFMRHPSVPGRIKIGKTKNLFIRTKNYYWMLEKSPIELLIFLQTPKYTRLEQLLLEELSSSTDTDEWVDERNALRFLEEVI